MRVPVLLLAAASLALCVSSLQAATIHVPADQPTIQTAVNAAVDGDSVLIADGVYTGTGNRNVDFLGKAVVVRSESENPYRCIIDCQADSLQCHRGFKFVSGEGPESVLEGVTVRNGYMNAPFLGGGVACQGSDPTFINCIFRNNTAYEGGGIDNTSGSHITVIGCRFIGNSADAGGGIATASGSSALVIGCTFLNNESPARYGAGLSLVWATGTVINSTFCGNAAPQGAAIDCGYGGILDASNCIVAFNSDAEGIFENNFGTATLTYCDIFGNEGGDWVGGIADQYGISGNISVDPMFVLPEMGDVRLLWHSPCIDTGDPASIDPDGTCSDMGACCFDQNDHLTLYLTPDATGVAPGGELGVTYTAINRQVGPEPFWALSTAALPGGAVVPVMGPESFTLSADVTVQVHRSYHITAAAPPGMYDFWTGIGMPPADLYDEDLFVFSVVD